MPPISLMDIIPWEIIARGSETHIVAYTYWDELERA